MVPTARRERMSRSVRGGRRGGGVAAGPGRRAAFAGGTEKRVDGSDGGSEAGAGLCCGLFTEGAGAARRGGVEVGAGGVERGEE